MKRKATTNVSLKTTFSSPLRVKVAEDAEGLPNPVPLV